MFDLAAIFGKNNSEKDRDRIAKLLQTDPSAIEAFESAYQNMAINTDDDNFFSMSSRDISADARTNKEVEQYDDATLSRLVDRIVLELTGQTKALSVSDGSVEGIKLLGNGNTPMVTNNDLDAVPASVRPQLTGELMKVDINAMSSMMLLDQYQRMQTTRNPKERQHLYHMFRQGMDILDLDPILYEMLSQNPNSMSHWLPAISKAAAQHGFFKIPKTKIAKLPMPLLQLTRVDYTELTPATLKIVDDWAMKTFDLDVNKSYFIKTGTYSSKFDFRNCKVTGEKEVRELGEYLLFIHFQALQMASPLSSPTIYGTSTTNEWVVREYIEDKEQNPCIYKGLPLHTEYRVFVDFDMGKVIGYTPYWEPNMMLKRFGEDSDESIHDRHDYVIFKAHEPVLMDRYNKNIGKVVSEVEKLLPDTNLHGQWSIDIMQNGDDFWLIDMATADTSALRECVPAETIKKYPENWLPNIGHKELAKGTV